MAKGKRVLMTEAEDFDEWDAKDMRPSGFGPMPLSEPWDMLILKRQPPEHWDQSVAVLYTMRSVRDFWGVLNNVRLSVGENVHRHMFQTEGLGIFRHGLKPVWGSGGGMTQSVWVKVGVDAKQFHWLLEEVGMALVGGMERLPGAFGVRVVDKSNKRSRFTRVEVWGDAEHPGFAGHAMRLLLRLCRQGGVVLH